jgi:hypothetical protein
MKSNINHHFQLKSSISKRNTAPTLLFRNCHFPLLSVTYFFLSQIGQTLAQAVRLLDSKCNGISFLGCNHEDYKWVN